MAAFARNLLKIGKAPQKRRRRAHRLNLPSTGFSVTSRLHGNLTVGSFESLGGCFAMDFDDSLISHFCSASMAIAIRCTHCGAERLSEAKTIITALQKSARWTPTLRVSEVGPLVRTPCACGARRFVTKPVKVTGDWRRYSNERVGD